MTKIHLKGKKRRVAKVRYRIKRGERERPRLSVFRSNRYIYAQIINNQNGKILVSVIEKELDIPKEKKVAKLEQAKLLGLLLGQKAKKLNISTVSFDRDGYKYHGKVRAFAEGVREAGIIF